MCEREIEQAQEKQQEKERERKKETERERERRCACPCVFLHSPFHLSLCVAVIARALQQCRMEGRGGGQEVISYVTTSFVCNMIHLYVT